MGDQRQYFRFRLPWLSAAAAPRPAAQPQTRPAAQTQAPAQPTTTIPIQRPPFRPAGIAPVQTTPTQAQAPLQKTESQAAAASRAATEPKATPKPASPPRLTNQMRAASVPPPPSRRATETQVTSRPVSPPRAPTQARAASVPPSPSRIASPPQSTVQTVSKQQSPSRLASQPAGQTSSQPSSPYHRATQVQPTLSPPKKLTMATQERSQPPSSTQPPLSASQETTFRPFGVAVRPSQASAQVKEVAPITVVTTETPSAPLKPKEKEERKKVAEERRKARAKGPTHEEPEQRKITKILAAATDAGTKTRELLGAAFETGKRDQEKQEEIERKKTWTTSSTNEKQIKTVSTYPKDGIVPKNSHQKHVTSNWEQVPLHKEIREDISKFVHKLTTEQPKLRIGEKSISVLTLAGEN